MNCGPSIGREPPARGRVARCYVVPRVDAPLPVLRARAPAVVPTLALLLAAASGLAAPQAAQRPGPVGEGVTLLPNGWRIAPAGGHLDVGDLPLAMAVHPDGRHVVISNNGWSKPSLRVGDLKRRQVVQKLAL